MRIVNDQDTVNISVCMATYNGAKYIRHQIDSIITQLGEFDELIISDDGSTDATLSIIDSYCDSRIKVYSHTEKSLKTTNACKATLNFENAIKYAQGRYIFLSDQDDVWLPNRVSSAIDLLVSNPDKWLLVSRAKCIDGDGQFVADNTPYKSEYSISEIIITPQFPGCMMCMTRDLLDKGYPFPKNTETHDAWLSLVAIKYGKLMVSNEFVMLYRKHGNNVSANINTTVCFKCWYRIRLLWNLIWR